MSYRRAREPAPAGRPPTVTVCTNDVALGNLVEDGLPLAISEAFRDLEALVLSVVELEHDRIVLTAVDARVATEEIDDIGRSFRN